MRFLVAEKLGPHKFKTPEGYLICTDAILSRTGKQEYKRCELFGDSCENPDKIVNVERTDDEVFSDKAMASFENKPICVEHPDHDVNAENHNELAVGFVRDIHKGEDNGKPVMMGTLVITDKDAVEAVESGEYKELSCGYDCDIDDDDEPRQRNIRGNHVALCKQGRAGIARIVDSVNDAWFGSSYPYEVWLSYPVTRRKFMAAAFKTRQEALQNTERLRQEWKNAKEGVPNAQIVERGVSDSVRDVDARLVEKYINNIGALENELRRKQDELTRLEQVIKECDYNLSHLGSQKTPSQNAIANEQRKKSNAQHDIKFVEAAITGLQADIAELKSIRQQRGDSMDFSKKTKQGYDVLEMYRDGGRLHVIFKRANDYGVALGYDTTDGQWAQGMYDYSTLNEAREALKETKPYAKRIQDSVNDDTWSNVEEENYEKANKAVIDEEYVQLPRGRFKVVAKTKEELKKEGYGYHHSANGYSVYVKNNNAVAIKDSTNHERLFTVEYEQDGVTYVRKVRASSIIDAISKVKDDGHKVVVFTNQVLNELGKNNSIGKYDKVVQAMRSLYSESLLPDDKLKELIHKKVPEYIKKYVKE